MRTRILRGPRQWSTIGPVWTALLAEVPLVSYARAPAWAQAISEQFHDEGSRWFVADDDHGPVAVLPYQVSVRRLGPLRVRVLANERSTDGLVAARLGPDELRRALLAAAAADGEPLDVLSLNGLRPRTAFLELATAGGSGLQAETQHGGHSVIATGVSGDEWFAAASKNLRAALRKARNRFERQGAMTITTATARDEVEAAFAEYVAIEATGWKADTDALANQPADHGVMRQFLLSSARSGRVSVRTLRLDGRPAAAQLTNVTAGTCELIKVAYDDALADLSPSNLLMADLVRDCCDRPDVARIDLITNQPWHRRWHADVYPTYKARDINLGRPAGLATRVAVALEGAGARLPHP